MVDLAKHIVETKSADFKPAKFEDRCENALVKLLNQKRKGEPVRTAIKSRETGNVINPMDALRKSITSEGKAAPTPAAAKKSSKKAPSGQRERTIAILGKGEGKKASAKEPKKSRPARAPQGRIKLGRSERARKHAPSIDRAKPSSAPSF
jgi:DNA end-binding protein Ku